MDYPGGFITKTAPTLNPALGNAAPGVWRLNDVLKNIKAGTWPSYDPYFENTTLLLHGNGTNGGQNNTFLDSSSNNFTITRNGNTTQGTFSPFSQTGWSNYFNGGSDRISNASANVADFATNNFTVEMFVFLTSTADQMFFEGPSNSGFQFFIDAGVLKAGNAGTASPVTYTLPSGFANTWHHICVVREGTGSNQTSLYVDGVRQSQGTLSTNFTTTGFQISRTASFLVYGYISNLRVVKGTAVYTAAFTPPTAPLTAISGTSLLICQSNRFVDNSGSSVALTIAGNTSVQAFSPFAPTAAYSASTVGGSGYFDGSGDYLTAPSNTALTTGTGNCTIEAWVYSAVSGPIIVDGSSGSVTSIYISNGGGNRVIFGAADYPSGGISTIITTSNSVSTNTWTHVALVRSSGTFTVYINGVSGGTSANTTDSYQLRTIGGIIQSGTPLANFSGYISDARIVKGTAVYTTAFTPPTAPLTNITNTSLLLNFTNAAIIDNTAKNVLETVGNAQISTSVSKFGGASLAFDGNGDYLLLPNTPDFALRTGNFTLEFWINFSSISSYQTIYSYGYTTSGDLLIQTGNGNGRMVVYVSGSAVITESGTATTGTWIHYALVRNGTTLTLYRDGTSSGSATNSADITTSEVVGIGANPLNYGGNPPGTYSVNGYIDDLRITKGIARYTSNFTPQTSQWQDQ